MLCFIDFVEFNGINIRNRGSTKLSNGSMESMELKTPRESCDHFKAGTESSEVRSSRKINLD